MHINNPTETPSIVIVRMMSCTYCHNLIDVDLTARQKGLQTFMCTLNPDSIDVKTTSHEGRMSCVVFKYAYTIGTYRRYSQQCELNRLVKKGNCL